jgi:hypothetical protein
MKTLSILLLLVGSALAQGGADTDVAYPQRPELPLQAEAIGKSANHRRQELSSPTG